MNDNQISKPPRPFFKNPIVLLSLVGLLGFLSLILYLISQQNYRIDGSDMQPTLSGGQYVAVNRWAYLFDDPQRGDIIVFDFPKDRSRQFLKRVIGLPKDEILMEKGDVTINETLIDEPYIKDRTPNNQTWTVTEDHYFVVGDNRRNSADSRSWSFLPEDDIIGRVWLVYWPPQSWQFISGYDYSNVPDPN